MTTKTEMIAASPKILIAKGIEIKSALEVVET